MRLLLFAERATEWPHLGTTLEVVRTEDGGIKFQPQLTYNRSRRGLSLVKCKCTDPPSLVHCKMIWGYFPHSEAENPDQPVGPCVTYETHVTLKNNESLDDILLCPYASRFQTVRLLFMVYESPATSPTTGAGFYLNRARLQGAHCDVKLVVSGVELAAHRAVLAARSPVLDKMLSGDYKEAREGRVELVDFPAAAVEKFIEFLYTDRIEDWGKSELELLRLADKYLVPDLRDACWLKLHCCDGARALELLHACAADPSLPVSSATRRLLAAIVVFHKTALVHTKEWTEFSKTYPVLVDVMLAWTSVVSARQISFSWKP